MATSDDSPRWKPLGPRKPIQVCPPPDTSWVPGIGEKPREFIPGVNIVRDPGRPDRVLLVADVQAPWDEPPAGRMDMAVQLFNLKMLPESPDAFG